MLNKLHIGALVALCLVAISLSVVAISISIIAITSLQKQTPAPIQTQTPDPTPNQFPGSTESNTIAPMVERVKAAVVNISASEPAPSVLNADQWRPQKSPEQQGRHDLGSGVVIDAENGYIVTNQHVIHDSKGIFVTLYDGRDFEAAEVGHDPLTDIAVLKIETGNLQELDFADSDNVQVGDSVVAIGSPFGLQLSVTSGLISALERKGVGWREVESFIQTDATFNIGNSGGPLLSFSGAFIGICTAGLRSSENIFVPGIAFAIPSNLVARVVEQLLALEGRTTREYFGLEVVSIDATDSENSRQKDKGEGTAGVKVIEVFEGTVAFVAGIKENDVITSFRDEPISDMRDFLYQLKISQIEEVVPIEIRRGTGVLTVYAQIAPPMLDGDRYHWSLSGSLLNEVEVLDESTNEVSELLYEVSSVRSNSLASKIGLVIGDLILRVDEHRRYGQLANVTVSREGKVVRMPVTGDF